MRGRTNITQRSGPVVIGNLVTRKQVTGSRINMGDFVEFTGDTSLWEGLSGPFNYQYSKSFEIMTLYSGSDVEDVTFGLFYINPTSSQCKLIVCDKNGIIKITNLSGINFEGCTGITDARLINNKLYISINSSKKVYVFNYNSSNYTITYNSTINVNLPTSSPNVYNEITAVLIGVRDNYIYGYGRSKLKTEEHYIIRMNINGSTVVNKYTFISSSFATGNEIEYNLFEADNYMFFVPVQDSSGGSKTDRIIFNYNNSSLVVQTPIGAELYGLYGSKGLMLKKNDYFIMVGQNKLCVFYLDENMDIHVVKYVTVSGATGDAYHTAAIVENSGSDYKIIYCYFGSSTNSSLLFCYLYNFNSDNSTIVRLNYATFGWDGYKSRIRDNLFLFDASDIYNVYFTGSDSSMSENYLYKTKFVINNDVFVQSESLDLVKPYENTINGVAKTGGNVGQEISVYIP